jgi:hypothetical protein
LPHPVSNSLTPPMLEIQLPNWAHSTFPSPLALVIQLPIQPFNQLVAFYSQCDHSIDRVQLPIQPFHMFSWSAPMQKSMFSLSLFFSFLELLLLNLHH